MKRFNKIFVVLWFSIFALTTLPSQIFGGSGGEAGTHRDNLVLMLVDGFAKVFGEPSELGNELRYTWGLDELLVAHLHSSFLRLLAFMFALNIAFYAGRGTYGRWMKSVGGMFQRDLDTEGALEQCRMSMEAADNRKTARPIKLATE